MILLNAGAPLIIMELPYMLVLLVGVITIEYYFLKKTGVTFSAVIWSNIVSTLVGIPLSNVARAILGNYIPGNQKSDPVEASIFIGDNWYEGTAFWVLLVILVFDYIFSVLLEYVYYRRRYTMDSKSIFFRQVVVANGISYLAMPGLILVLYVTGIF